MPPIIPKDLSYHKSLHIWS